LGVFANYTQLKALQKRLIIRLWVLFLLPTPSNCKSRTCEAQICNPPSVGVMPSARATGELQIKSGRKSGKQLQIKALAPVGGAPTGTRACAAGNSPVPMLDYFSSTAPFCCSKAGSEWLTSWSGDVWAYQGSGRCVTDHGYSTPRRGAGYARFIDFFQ
jgi:hypothetical protein